MFQDIDWSIVLVAVFGAACGIGLVTDIIHRRREKRRDDRTIDDRLNELIARAAMQNIDVEYERLVQSS